MTLCGLCVSFSARPEKSSCKWFKNLLQAPPLPWKRTARTLSGKCAVVLGVKGDFCSPVIVEKMYAFMEGMKGP